MDQKGSIKNRLELILLYLLAISVFSLVVTMFIYNLNNPELTRIQVLLYFKWYYLPLLAYALIYGIKHKIAINRDNKTEI